MKRSVALLLLLGACVSAPKRPVVAVPEPRPAPPLPPPPVLAWEDRARTPGNWSYSRNGAGSDAVFAAGSATSVTINCPGDGWVWINRSGPAGGSMTIRTTSLVRTLAVETVGQLPAGSSAKLPANDPLLDAIVYSRGKFLLAVPGQPDLILPPWPEIARVVEDCRR